MNLPFSPVPNPVGSDSNLHPPEPGKETSSSGWTLKQGDDTDRVLILGVSFFTGSLEKAVECVIGGGLLMLPSGPGLACDLPNSMEYRESLAAADFVLPDSGAMVLIWNFLNRKFPDKRVSRISGLRFLRALIERKEIREPGYTFWVMPSDEEQRINLAWLKSTGFTALTEEDCYVAPHYRKHSEKYNGLIQDPDLVRVLDRRRPAMIFLNVGSGVQEPLGGYLKASLSYRPAIICSGAAIAFLTGEQANIPPWADSFYLGWLLRIFQSPRRFGSRYLKAMPLFSLLLRYRSKSPIPGSSS